MPKKVCVLLLSLCVALPSPSAFAGPNGCTPWWSKISLRTLLLATTAFAGAATWYGYRLRREQAFEVFRHKATGHVPDSAAASAWVLVSQVRLLENMRNNFMREEKGRKKAADAGVDWKRLREMAERIEDLQSKPMPPDGMEQMRAIYLEYFEDVQAFAKALEGP